MAARQRGFQTKNRNAKRPLHNNKEFKLDRLGSKPPDYRTNLLRIWAAGAKELGLGKPQWETPSRPNHIIEADMSAETGGLHPASGCERPAAALVTLPDRQPDLSQPASFHCPELGWLIFVFTFS